MKSIKRHLFDSARNLIIIAAAPIALAGLIGPMLGWRPLDPVTTTIMILLCAAYLGFFLYVALTALGRAHACPAGLITAILMAGVGLTVLNQK